MSPPTTPPLTPTADEARRQLQEELLKPEYLQPQDWLDEGLDRLIDWLNGADLPAVNPPAIVGPIVAGLILAGVAAVLFSIFGPTRRRRPATGLMADEDRTAVELRAEADSLAGNGEWATAILQRFRGVVRALSERAIILETPGMTAHEASAQASERLPDLAARLGGGADVFDAIAYGGRPGSPERYRAMVELDDAVAAAKPVQATAHAMAEAVDQPGTRVTHSEPELVGTGAGRD
ncbi:MAG: DUF4129 domain-containing protein [Propionibacteriaceae bacterium]|jgi:hypothetical protein|nr:DUF4129 domain-containing protein [Propionibacteriaceae bacterium]